MRRSAWVMAAILASGCAAAPRATPEEKAAYEAKARAVWDSASKVRVTINPEQVRDCQSLGVVSMPWGAEINVMKDPDGRSEGMSDSERYLRLETVKLGGDAALASTQTAPQETRAEYLPTDTFHQHPYDVTGEAAHVAGERARHIGVRRRVASSDRPACGTPCRAARPVVPMRLEWHKMYMRLWVGGT